MNNKPFDIVLFGATSFVGQITTRYMLEKLGPNGQISWAIAGRSEQKLNQLKSSLGAAADNVPLIIADSKDAESLSALCRQSRVVISTVGPYLLYGEPMIKACADNGTDYCDLTGEAYWIKLMIDKYQATAEQSGARLINCCGFDSIPSDLGVHYLQQQAHNKFGQYFDQVKLGVNAIKGGASGGTIASMIEMLNAAKADPEARQAMGDPYLLCPQNQSYQIRQSSLKGTAYDRDFHCWSAPFVMEAINSRVVLRSNALQNMRYSDKFSYQEVMLTGVGFKGWLRGLSLSLGLAGFVVAMMIGPIRRLMQKSLLPKPGEGPSETQQQNGYYDLRIVGQNEQQQMAIKVTGDRDPGYGSTAKILAQAGLCMALDVEKTDLPGGFWTPSTAMGDKLVARLIQHAGLGFEVIE